MLNLIYLIVGASLNFMKITPLNKEFRRNDNKITNK